MTIREEQLAEREAWEAEGREINRKLEEVRNMKPYEIILQQLGGINKITAMTGAKNFMYSSKDPNFIEFKFKSCKKANHVKIEYDKSKDLYEMIFYKIKRVDGLPTPKIVRVFNCLFASDLIYTFEQYTGLRLSL